LLLVVRADAADVADAFYKRMFERGRTDALAGNFARAIPELQTAAFGSVQSIADYEMAHAYLAFALAKVGRQEEALASARKINQAEHLQRMLPSLSLEPHVRSTTEQLLAQSRGPARDLTLVANMPAAEIASTATPSNSARPQQANIERSTRTTDTFAMSPAPAVVAPASTAPVPAPEPAISASATVRPGSMAATPAAHGVESLARYRSGDEGGALALAEATVAEDPTNGPAHEVLALMAAKTAHWNEVVTHLSTARTRQRLTDEEAGMLFLAYLYTGRNADAAGMHRILPAGALRSTAVADAVRKLDAVAVPAPQPRPGAPVSVAVATPTSRAPQPTTAAPSRPLVQPAQPVTTPLPAVRASVPAPAPMPTSKPASTPATTRPAPAQPQPSVPAQRTVSPAPQPQPIPETAGSGRTLSAAPAQQDSPLVAASRRTPSATVGSNDVATRLAEAQSQLQQGKILAARAIYARLAAEESLPRATVLQVARGLNQVSAWIESSTEYARATPFVRGEEMHMFYEAVNRFELGDVRQARELLRRALPSLPATREVATYRARIEAGR
jgi:outer membrane biosynthesis protein TonB